MQRKKSKFFKDDGLKFVDTRRKLIIHFIRSLA